MLSDALGDAIEAVTAMHRGTCSVTDPSSPQASIAVLRLAGNRADYLVLGDCYVIAESAPPVVITDAREVAVRESATLSLKHLAPGTPGHDRELHRAIEEQRAQRNRPGGYWIAKDDPAAAHESIVGDIDLESVACLAVLSNGAARLVDAYRVVDWSGLFDMLHAGGPANALHRLRKTESHNAATPDDATIAFLHVGH